MKTLRLRNIRSLADTGDLELKPITLLLGRNSSGKSTVLRTIPLLTQSIRTRSNAPVLWYGDLVDFGSAREVRSTFAGSEAIEIELGLGPVVLSRNSYYYMTRRDDERTDTRLRISLVEADGKTRLRSFALHCDSDIFEVELDGRGIASRVLVNGLDLTRLFPGERYRFTTTELAPQIVIRSSPDNPRRAYYPGNRRAIETAEPEIRRFLQERLPKRVLENTVLNITHRMFYRPGWKFVQSLQEASGSLKSMRALSDSLTVESGVDDYEYLRALYMAWESFDILSSVERKISQTFNNVSYVGPSRATGERYYRMQELAVDQIDPQGRNLAMFLNSLSATQQKAFSAWLYEAVGYEIQVERSAGHIQLHLREEGSSKFYNIADMGYGFSQVLPIMAQVWSRQNRSTGPASTILIAMEQPELHLHPAYQAKLADIFAKSLSPARPTARSKDVRFIIETHSEALVNRLGELIYENMLSPDDVAIYVFEKDLNGEATDIQTVKYESDGTLSNWPIGFFSAAS